MLRATAIVRKPAVKADRVVETVTLDHRSRAIEPGTLTADDGLAFVVDLDRAGTLNDGDALRLEDGRLVQVKGAPERLLEVRAENPARLMKLAYQAGGQHLAVEIAADALYLEDHPATAELVRGQGCTGTPVTRPFRPEPEVHAHDCSHDHGHAAHDHHGHSHAGQGHAAHDHHGHSHAGHDHHGHDGHSHRHSHAGHDHHGHGSHDHAHEGHHHGHGHAGHDQAGQEHRHGDPGHDGHHHHATHSHDHGHGHSHSDDHEHAHEHAPGESGETRQAG